MGPWEHYSLQFLYLNKFSYFTFCDFHSLKLPDQKTWGSDRASQVKQYSHYGEEIPQRN
jgi:hypothetical protein